MMRQNIPHVTPKSKLSLYALLLGCYHAGECVKKISPTNFIEHKNYYRTITITYSV